MSDEKPPEKPGALKGSVEIRSATTATLTSVLYAALPDKKGDEIMDFYQRVDDATPAQLFAGYYGFVDSDENGGTITLFMHDGDRENPKLAMKMLRQDFINFADALHQIRRRRYGSPG